MPDPVIPSTAEFESESLIAEILPPDCPPSNAGRYHGTVYRSVGSNPCSIEDFKSYYELYPKRVWKEHERCPARGLSIRMSQEAAQRHVDSLNARVKATQWYVARANFSAPGETLAQTFTDPAHFTWWPSAAFDFLASFAVIDGGQP